MTARKLTLGDLVGYTELHLRLLTGEHGLDRQVRGAHATELEQPTRWLEADYVMLTVGTRLTTAPPDAQRQLVRELEQARIAALGFGTGLGFDVVPEGVLAEAAALDFPVFEVPFATPFRSVVSFVHESIASDQAFDLRRRLSIEHHLMEALGQPDAEHELFRRIAGVARGAVALVSAGGRVLHQEGSVPTDAIRRRAVPGVREQRVDVDGQSFVALEIGVDELTRRLLLVEVDRRGSGDGLLGPLLSAAETMLRLVERAQLTRRSDERLRRAELLDALLAGVDRATDDRVRDRLTLAGFDDRPMHVVVVVGVAEAEAETTLRRLEGSAEMEDLPLLLTRRGDRVVALVQGEPGALPVWLAQAAVDAAAGVSRVIGRIDEVGTAAREADVAARCAAERTGPGPRVWWAGDLDVADWVLVEHAGAALEERAAGFLRPLEGQPLVLEAVVAYLRSDFDVVRAARELHLHPNSLRYRLTRAEQLLDRRLRSPAVIASLYLALHDQLR